jgi:hypothetical protein
MSRPYKYVVAMLCTVAALDLVAAVLGSRVTGHAKPPPPAMVAIVLFAILSLVAIYGLWRGAGWARPVIYVTRGLDVVSSLLGLGDRPSHLLEVIGAVTLVLSVAVIVILVRTPATPPTDHTPLRIASRPSEGA